MTDFLNIETAAVLCLAFTVIVGMVCIANGAITIEIDLWKGKFKMRKRKK